MLRIERGSNFVSQHLDQLSYNLRIYALICQHDRFEVGIDWFQRDPLMTPGVVMTCLFALVALDGIALTGLRVVRVMELDQDGFPLSRALDRSTEKAVRTVGDGRLHGLAYNLGDEHPLVKSAPCCDFNPLKAAILDVLRIAEGAGRDLEWDQRSARFITIFGLRIYSTRTDGDSFCIRRHFCRFGPQPPIG